VARTRGSTTRPQQRALWGLAALSALGLAAYGWRWWGDPLPRWPSFVFPALGAFWASVIGLVVLNAGARWLAPLRWPVLRETGKRSYGLYMYHYPVLMYGPQLLRRAGVDAEPVAALLTWTILLLLVLASYRWYEKPFLALKARFGYGRPARGDSGVLAQATTL
jgi:peptidoglycan/LPS O-acetylase OafA/YrhL